MTPITLHTISTLSFIRSIMREQRNYRRMKQKRSFTQRDTAEAAGTNHVYLGQFESGVRNPTLFDALTALQTVKEWAA